MHIDPFLETVSSLNKQLSSDKSGTGTIAVSIQYLAVVGDGLFVFIDNVLLTQAVLRSSDLGAGVGADAIGCESPYAHKKKKNVLVSFKKDVSLRKTPERLSISASRH